MKPGLSRRDFLGSFAAFGAVGALRGFAAPAGSFLGPGAKLTFGLLSDIHCSTFKSEGNPLAGFGCETFIHALEYFRDKGVDAVAIAGDLTNHGTDEELMAVSRAWYQVFPNDEMPDGRKVAKIFHIGNHEWEGYKYGHFGKKRYLDPEEMKRHVFPFNQEAFWEKAFHEPFKKVYRKDVKGYTFICAHGPSQKKAAAKFLKAELPKLDPAKPFFYLQHPPPGGTLFGAWDGAAFDDIATELAKYPNAVSCSGHTHQTITDERAIWQGPFTAVESASLRYAGNRPGLENSGPKRNAEFRQMGLLGREQPPSRQGLLVTVYDDRIVFARREFVTDGALGPDWVVPLKANVRPYGYKVRADAEPAPAFAEDAKVSISEEYEGKNRGGATCRQVKVTFPAALPSAKGRSRALSYEVRVLQTMGDLVRFPCLARRVLSKGVNRPEALEPKEVELVLNAGEIQHECKLEFEVTALGCFGRRSKPIISEPTKLKGVVVKW